MVILGDAVQWEFLHFRQLLTEEVHDDKGRLSPKENWPFFTFEVDVNDLLIFLNDHNLISLFLQ